jgi:hypothetical protein
VALKAAPALGEKVTEMEQLAPGARVAVQVLVWENAAGLAPASEMPEMLSGALPGFVRVSFCEALVVATVWLAKARLAGVRTACGTSAAVPVPVRVADCGELAALSST